MVSAFEDDIEMMMSTGNSMHNLKPYSNRIINLWNHYINAGTSYLEQDND
jgi:hypothetical protein